MIFVALGRWSSAHGRWFTRERIYYKGYRWTPFVHVSWRYRNKDGQRKATTLEIHLSNAIAAGGGENYVRLCGQEIPVTDVNLSIRAGEFTRVTLSVIPQQVDVILPEDIEVTIQDYQWLRVQGIINAAQEVLWNNVPGCYGRRLHAPAPVDDTGSIWRISSDYYYQDGKRYGLRTEWIGTQGRSAMITVDNVVEVFTLLKDEFEEIDPRTIWLPTASKYCVLDNMLWKGDEKVAGLPSAAEAKQEATDGNQEE